MDGQSIPIESIIQAIATVIVAIVGLVGIIIQTRNRTKLIKQEDLLNTVDKKIDKIRKESKDGDERLHERLNNMEMQSCKRFLVSELTKVKVGHYIPNENQKRILHDTKKIYNDRGGDSYVDTMFDSLIKENKL